MEKQILRDQVQTIINAIEQLFGEEFNEDNSELEKLLGDDLVIRIIHLKYDLEEKITN